MDELTLTVPLISGSDVVAQKENGWQQKHSNGKTDDADDHVKIHKNRCQNAQDLHGCSTFKCSIRLSKRD